jgi:hypothetical protein
MAGFLPTSPVTGATGFTSISSPTYTLTSAQGPANGSKKYVVTALGGTQTNVRAHTASDPFCVTAFLPQTYRSLVTDSNGNIRSVPYNRYNMSFQKGVYVLSATPSSARPINARLIVDMPAGCETVDAVNIDALNSFIGGLLSQQANEWSETVIGGYLG